MVLQRQKDQLKAAKTDAGILTTDVLGGSEGHVLFALLLCTFGLAPRATKVTHGKQSVCCKNTELLVQWKQGQVR